jgi:hypothetical protein
MSGLEPLSFLQRKRQLLALLGRPVFLLRCPLTEVKLPPTFVPSASALDMPLAILPDGGFGLRTFAIERGR